MAKYIVNRHGATHSIPDGWPLPDGSRLATDDEIAAWWKAQGVEVSNGESQHEPTDQPGERPHRRPRRN